MDKKTKAILFLIISSLGFAAMGACVKLAGNLPSIQKSFFRNLVSCFVALILILKHKKSFFGKRENQKYLLARSILGTLGIIANFYAIDHMMLADASMLNKLSPFFLTIFAIVFLKENMKPVQIVALVCAFTGSLFIIKPSFSLNTINALIGVASAIFAGGAYTFVRFLGDKEEYYTIVFYFSFVSLVLTLPSTIIGYAPMSMYQLSILLLAGVFASVGQFGITVAYKYAPASEISIFDYVNIIFSAIIGFIMWNEVPDVYSVLGYFLIIGASIYVFYYNKRRCA